MSSSPVTSGQIDGETMETVTDFIFLGSKINADSDCSYEINNLDIILKGKASLCQKICLVKAMIFPVVMYGCESWTIKKAER